MLGTYVTDAQLVLRGPSSTKRIARSAVSRLTVADAQPFGSPAPFRAGFVVTSDGRQERLPGVSWTRLTPQEPEATVKCIAEAIGVPAS
jgi:hypothetical protein